jgi:hypothetical protein
MMNVDLPQTGTSTVYGVDGDTNDLGVDMGHTVTVLDAAGGWTPLVKDLYVDGKAGMHRIRVGVQKPIFSTMDRYDDYNAYFLGGLDAHKALAWRMGIVPSRDLGARWSVAPSSSFSVDLQVSNGTGERALENNPGKDLSGRVVLEPHELVRIEGSVLHGARGALGKDSLSAFALAAELRTRGPRLIAEALMGNAMLQETAHGFMGVSITGAWPIEIPGERIDHLVILGRYMTGDPDTRDGEGDDFASGVDAWGMGNLATQLYWKTTRPEQTLLSGLSYEVLVPQNAEIPVGHGLVAQLAWKF